MQKKKSTGNALAALAAISCSITTISPPAASARESRDTTTREQQMVEKMIRALENSLETPLLRAGWKSDGERTPLPYTRIAKKTGPLSPLMMHQSDSPCLNISVSPSAMVRKIDVPGVPLAIQLSTPPDRRTPLPEIETQLHFGNWSHARITTGNDAWSVSSPFQHPGETPFIVNMVVHIRATPQVSEDLLREIDWQQIGSGLTFFPIHHSNR
jgi:hypothetical protein